MSSSWICTSSQVLLWTVYALRLVLKRQLQNKQIQKASQWKKFNKCIHCSLTFSYIGKIIIYWLSQSLIHIMKLGQLMANSGYLPKLSFVILNILSFADRLRHEKSTNFNSKHATGHTADDHVSCPLSDAFRTKWKLYLPYICI